MGISIWTMERTKTFDPSPAEVCFPLRTKLCCTLTNLRAQSSTKLSGMNLAYQRKQWKPSIWFSIPCASVLPRRLRVRQSGWHSSKRVWRYCHITEIAVNDKRSTLTWKDMETSVLLLFSGELTRCVIAEGWKSTRTSVVKWTSYPVYHDDLLIRHRENPQIAPDKSIPYKASVN